MKEKKAKKKAKLAKKIGARFTPDQIVEAHRLVDTGHKQGSVVVTCTPADGRRLAGIIDAI